MATADVVEVRFDAEVTKYLADLNLADKSVKAITERMTANAIKAGTAFSNIGSRGGLTPVVDGLDRADQSAGQFSGNVGNLAAQFQDIGVTAAAGMNPLIIALQQGTQISAVLNQSVASGVSPVKALGSAFLSVVNPVSLATIALVALGAAAIQALSSIIPATEDANEAIKKHREELEGIVSGYEAAEDAVEDYFTIAERLPAAIASGKIVAEFGKITASAEAFREKVAQAASNFEGKGGFSDALPLLAALSQRFADGEISAQQFYDGLSDVEKAMSLLDQVSAGIPGSIQSIINEFREGAIQAIAFENSINNLVAASHALASVAGDVDLQNALDLSSYVAEQERLNGLTSEQLDLEKEIANIKKDAGELGITDEKAKELAEAALAADERRAKIKKDLAESSRDSTKTADAAERERKAVTDLIEQLEFELDLIGMTNEQKAIALAIREAGAAATEQERIEIERLIIAQRAQNAELKRAEELYDNIKAAASNALKVFLNDIREGKSAGEAFTNVLDDILGRLIDFGISTALNAIFPGLGTLAGGLSGSRASGGPVRAGGTYMVGENGPERFTPTQAGNITRNGGDPPMSGGGRMTIYLGPGLEANLLDKAAEQSVQIVRSTVPPMISRGAPTAVAQSNRNRVA